MRSPIFSSGGAQRRTPFGVGGWCVSQVGGRWRCVDDHPMQLARDDLQTTMIAETNRKRRKLERDRRAAERPQPGESTTVLCNYLRRINFKQCFVSPPFHTRSLFRQHSTRLSTKTHKAPPLVAVARGH